MDELRGAIDYMGFLRHGQAGLNNKGGGTVMYCPPVGIIQCLLHPVIPWPVAPQQSLPPFHRATGISPALYKSTATGLVVDCSEVWNVRVRIIERIRTHRFGAYSAGPPYSAIQQPSD